MSDPQIHFVRRGSGPPLLLVHGLGGSAGIWTPVMDRLAAERDVIAVDLPGFGNSPPAGDRTPRATAATLAGLCRSLEVERPHVAGNSLGAWVALEMAEQGNAASVAAISPAGMWRHALGPRSYSAHGLGNRLRPVINAALRSKRGRRVILRSTMARPDLMPSADAIALVSSYLDSPGYAAANAAMRGEVFEHDGLVDVPVAIAWGVHDRVVGRPSHSRIPPGATLVEMPGWGHMPTWDDPRGVAAFLLSASSETLRSVATRFRCLDNPCGRLAQLARAPALHAGGRRFESGTAHPGSGRARTGDAARRPGSLRVRVRHRPSRFGPRSNRRRRSPSRLAQGSSPAPPIQV